MRSAGYWPKEGWAFASISEQFCRSRYDALADVAEKIVQWRSVFQSGSRVLEIVLWPFSYPIYGIQCDFMQWKVAVRCVIWGHQSSEMTQNSPKTDHLMVIYSFFLDRYGINWVLPGDFSCPDSKEYAWQRGIERLWGRAVYGRPKLTIISRKKKVDSRRCYE